MALFGKKKTADTETAPAPAVGKGAAVNPRSIIVRPRITEKAALLIDRDIYTFEVVKGANKHEVKAAVKALYNVTPVAVNIVNQPARRYHSRQRGREMVESGRRKAYVTVKKGDKLDLS
jgi:large subunit ribosomal protein L23